MRVVKLNSTYEVMIAAAGIYLRKISSDVDSWTWVPGDHLKEILEEMAQKNLEAQQCQKEEFAQRHYHLPRIGRVDMIEEVVKPTNKKWYTFGNKDYANAKVDKEETKKHSRSIVDQIFKEAEQKAFEDSVIKGTGTLHLNEVMDSAVSQYEARLFKAEDVLRELCPRLAAVEEELAKVSDKMLGLNDRVALWVKHLGVVTSHLRGLEIQVANLQQNLAKDSEEEPLE